jgi:hypothetical protein
MKRASYVVLGLLFAFACKKAEQTTSTTQSTTTVSTSTMATPPQPAPVTPVPATTTSAPAAAAPAGAIASTDGEKPGTHIDITELKRTSGGTVNLKFTLSNTGSEKLGMSSNLGDHVVSSDYYRGVSGIHLIDPVNKKKYFVVTDSEKNCLCSKDAPDIDPGGKLNLWAKFPAPPPEVAKVTIEIPHFAPIDDVPISQ